MSLTNLVIIGIAVMLLMALSVVLFVVMYQRRVIHHQLEIKTMDEKKQMELLQASLQSEEEERRRIAGELHDDVGATLASARLFLHQAIKIAPGVSIIQQSGELIDESIGKIRSISHKLQPAALQTLGLYASLHALADLYNRSGSIKVNAHAENSLPRLPDHTELHMYRIIQELLNNIIKHSNATTISIFVSSASRELIASITHDGRGIIDNEYKMLLNKKEGIGLKNISNRLQFIKGEISFHHQKELYEIKLNVPVNS